MSSGDKQRFVARLRAELDEIRSTKKGRVTKEDVQRIVGQLRTFTEEEKMKGKK